MENQNANTMIIKEHLETEQLEKELSSLFELTLKMERELDKAV